MSETPEKIQEQALRAQYAASGLGRLGISFERAMTQRDIATSLLCGARAAERAAQHHYSRPHWSDKNTT